MGTIVSEAAWANVILQKISRMKNAAVILNAVLLIAVAVLFYLHFSSGKTASKPVVKGSSKTETAATAFKIAYFEMDSIQNSFSMVKEVTSELNQKEQAMMNDLARMEKALYDKANEYQNRASAMSATESEMATNDMNQRRRSYEMQREKYQQEYQDYSIRRTNEIKQAIQEFLKEYNKSKQFSYIISNEPGFIYFRDTVYNITDDVVKGLNDKYPAKKKK